MKLSASFTFHRDFEFIKIKIKKMIKFTLNQSLLIYWGLFGHFALL
jgi:hypothetical protein